MKNKTDTEQKLHPNIIREIGIREIEKYVKIGFEVAKQYKTDNYANCIAEILYDAGYRKNPENAVVLTREEHQKYLAFKIIEPQVRGCLDRERELEKRLETISKETVEKFSERLRIKLMTWI